MAVYKVIQDIESEDKLIGPLTLKGFIYAAIAILLGFINFRLLLAGDLGPLRYLFILIFLPPMLLFVVLASPLGREQPTEVWLLSRIRFFFKPHRRIWDQSGMSHTVTITAPKKVERQLTKNLSQKEVSSRLKALATTLDSRGWAVKNSALNLNDAPAPGQHEQTDRLVKPSALARTAPAEVHPADDILDENHNPTAKKFDSLIKKADAERKKSLFDYLKDMVIEEGHDKGSKPKSHSSIRPDVQQLQSLHHQQPAHKPRPRKVEHTEKTEPAHEVQPKPAGHKEVHKKPKNRPKKQRSAPVTAASQAVKLELAQSGNDLSVASIAHLANRPSRVRQIGPGEIEISLR